jgi:hypothetical protein
MRLKLQAPCLVLQEGTTVPSQVWQCDRPGATHSAHGQHHHRSAMPLLHPSPPVTPPPLDVNPLPSKPSVTVRQPTWCCAQVQQCFAVLQEAILAVQLNELECSTGAEPEQEQDSAQGQLLPTEPVNHCEHFWEFGRLPVRPVCFQQDQTEMDMIAVML